MEKRSEKRERDTKWGKTKETGRNWELEEKHREWEEVRQWFKPSPVALLL